MSAGHELLIVDGVERDREGLRAYFDARGYVCTAVDSGTRAAELAGNKVFEVALVDLDIGREHGGIDVIETIRRRSRITAIVGTTGRRSFDAAVHAFRAGAIDVVLKDPESVDHLAHVVERAALRSEASAGGDLFGEVRGVLDEAFKVMLQLSRGVYAHLSAAKAPIRPRVLIVDGDQEFMQELSWLVEDEPWEVHAEMSGGAALDKGMTTSLDIVASRAELMDLRGSMLVKSIQAQSPEVVGLVYSTTGDGRIDRYEQGLLVSSSDPPGRPEDLFHAVAELVSQLDERAQERRVIQAFTGEHREFVKRYADLKQKIDRLISE